MGFQRSLLQGLFLGAFLTKFASASVSAAVTVSGATSTFSSTTIIATETDESGILAEETGVAYLYDVTVYKEGDTSSTDDSAFTDLNAAVALETYGKIYMYNCNITTRNGEGANALHTYEDGTEAYLYDLYILAEDEFSHGIYTAGGYIYAENMECSTYGTSSSAIATDSGGGTIEVYDSTANTYGLKSALIYSTGNITAENLTGASARSPACVIDGSNSWTLVDPDISCSPEEHGCFQTQSTAGGSSSSTAYAYVTGGSVAETGGTYCLIFASNINFYIYLDSVDVSISSGILANASADDWGTSGSNGGSLYISLTSEDIEGDVYVDDISVLELSLYSTTWSGAINNDNTEGSATVYLDSDSTWTVTGDSYVEVLEDEDTTCSNIVSDGYTVYYDSSSNSWLDGETISLSGGGSLTPA